MFGLWAQHVDHWEQKLSIHGSVGALPVFNAAVVHHIVHRLANDPFFALIETEYFGGAGEQSAAVYRGSTEVMAPKTAPIGPINEALALLGVRGAHGRDEFETVGLVQHRSLSCPRDYRSR